MSGPAQAATAPGAPSEPSATPGNAQVGLSWVAPANSGGAAITDYRVQYRLSSATAWTTFADGTSTATTATVTGLVNASAYSFQIAAINSLGAGAYSSIVSATPRTVPGVVTGLSATVGNAQVGLSWGTPASTGGAAITDYQMQYKLTSASTWTTLAKTASATTTPR